MGAHRDLLAYLVRRLLENGANSSFVNQIVDESVPPWKDDPENPSGWVTAEYSMLPGSTAPRKRRERQKVDGRSSEIQRLVGRSLRAAVDFVALGSRTITVDCDVLEADGGTRTLSITGGFIALVDGRNILPMASSQDHKAALDGDTGPNTGGMGAYSPAPVLSPALEQQAIDEIIRPTDDRCARVESTAGPDSPRDKTA